MHELLFKVCELELKVCELELKSLHLAFSEMHNSTNVTDRNSFSKDQLKNGTSDESKTKNLLFTEIIYPMQLKQSTDHLSRMAS